MIKDLLNNFISRKQHIYLGAMGHLNLIIDDKLENEFRRVAVEKFGAKKGFLKKAVEEALSEWIKKNQTQSATPD
jgi:hypothetical protein